MRRLGLACALVSSLGTLARSRGSSAQCSPESWEPHLDVHVIEGRPALRRPLARALDVEHAALTACHARTDRGASESRGIRRSDALVTVHPDGHLEAHVVLGDTRDRDPQRVEADRAADTRLEACLVRTLSRPTLRPRPSRPATMRVLLHYEPIHHPAQPCSDPSGPVR